MNINEFGELEKRGVFIHFSWEHYKNGSNLNFSIEFRKHGHQTGWYGDNHEYGEATRTYECAIKMAKYYLENPILMRDGTFGINPEPEVQKVKEDFWKFHRTLFTEEHLRWVDELDD